MTMNLESFTDRVLVIDDEEDIRIGTSRALSKIDCIVFTANGGEKGLEIIENEPVSIVLLDTKMPGMDGMQVLQKIKEINEDIIVIIITGFATVEMAVESMKKGAYDLIPKPFEPDHVRIVVKRAIERLKLAREAEKLAREQERTLADLDAEKSRVHTIIESLPDGLLVTDTSGNVVLMNPAFNAHFDLNSDFKTGLPIENYIKDKDLCKLITDVSAGKHIDIEDISTYELPMPGDRHLLARPRPVLGDRMGCIGAVVDFIDISDIKVLDKLETEFVGKVSHELRSPLSTIHEQLGVVLNEVDGKISENGQYMLSRAKEKTKVLISFIGNLLDLSRLESGAASVKPVPMDIKEVLKNIVSFIEVRAKSKSQTLLLELPDEPLPPIVSGPATLNGIFENLITNAVNYTAHDGEIKIAVDITGFNIRVRVSDNGFGIEAKYLDKIFDKFYRVKNNKTRYVIGSGLGLSIVKGYVDLLNGIIEVSSIPGEGTTFTVLLPASR